jgi:hypothetical protein
MSAVKRTQNRPQDDPIGHSSGDAFQALSPGGGMLANNMLVTLCGAHHRVRLRTRLYIDLTFAELTQ